MGGNTNIDLDAIPRDAIPAAIAYLAARLLNPECAAQTPVEQKDPLLTVSEAAALLRLAPSYVYELVRSQQLPAMRSGKYIRIRTSTVEHFIALHENGALLDRAVDKMSTRCYDTRRSTEAPPTAWANSGRTRRPFGDGQNEHLQMGTRRRANPKVQGAATQVVDEADAKGAISNDGHKKAP
jgi:excisionase family DNA binding protein